MGAVLPELIGKFNLIFYQSPENAVFKALGVEQRFTNLAKCLEIKEVSVIARRIKSQSIPKEYLRKEISFITN